MSLRDFNSSSEDRPVILNHEPMGNGAGLGAFHTINPEDREPNNLPKIVGALAVALMVGTAGAYVYSVSGKSMQPKPVTVASNVQAPVAPVAPQPAAMTAPAADATATPVSTPAPEPMAAPMKTASVAKTRTASSKPVTQAAAIPEPVSPTPSRADIAANTPVPAPVAVTPAVTPDSQMAQNGTVAVQPQQSVTPTVEATPAPAEAAPVAPATQPAPAPAQ